MSKQYPVGSEQANGPQKFHAKRHPRNSWNLDAVGQGRRKFCTKSGAPKSYYKIIPTFYDAAQSSCAVFHWLVAVATKGSEKAKLVFCSGKEKLCCARRCGRRLDSKWLGSQSRASWRWSGRGASTIWWLTSDPVGFETRYSTQITL